MGAYRRSSTDWIREVHSFPGPPPRVVCVVGWGPGVRCRDISMPKPLVIVESPAKARTLSRFLGNKYRVEASYGHIRDLPESASEVPAEIKGKPWGRLGVDTDGDFTPYYVVPADKKKNVTALKAAMKEASELILATDPDREGESISWHLKELLKPKV